MFRILVCYLFQSKMGWNHWLLCVETTKISYTVLWSSSRPVWNALQIDFNQCLKLCHSYLKEKMWAGERKQGCMPRDEKLKWSGEGKGSGGMSYVRLKWTMLLGISCDLCAQPSLPLGLSWLFAVTIFCWSFFLEHTIFHNGSIPSI